MRNESLHAYSLHQRPYQDKRSIYYLLTEEHGVLHGIAKKGIPQFVPLMLFATGKKSLKTLQQVNIVEPVPSLMGQQQYAALYINEITLKLLPVEDSMPIIYQQYGLTIHQLQQELSLDTLKMILRIYEQVLFSELGFAIDFDQDSDQIKIKSDEWYHFAPDRGWVRKGGFQKTSKSNDSHNIVRQAHRDPSAFMQYDPIKGETIKAMRLGITIDTIKSWTDVHRQLVDHLFDYQPLQSRILWQQFYRYQ